MFDIVREIWKDPGSAWSCMPVWLWDAEPEKEEMIRQMDFLHRHGVGTLLIREEGLSEEAFLAAGEAAAEAAAKRRMMLVFSVPDGAVRDPEKPACRMHARFADGEMPGDETPLYRIWVKREKGLLAGVALEEKEGYECVLLTAGPDGSGCSDRMDQDCGDRLIRGFLSPAGVRFAEAGGTAVAGFFIDGSGELSFTPDQGEGIPWTGDLIEEFFEAGGDFDDLAALFFEPKEKKRRRDGLHYLRQAAASRLRRAFYEPLGKWCAGNGFALYGISDAAQDLLDVPVRRCGAGTAEDAAAVKLAADTARHRGLPRGGVILSGKETTLDETMRGLEKLFAGGAGLVIPGTVSYGKKEKDAPSFAPLTGYLKRMSWLNGVGSNHPVAAVLWEPGHPAIPSVAALDTAGLPYNYVTPADLFARARILDGTICLDRYRYDRLLIDGTFRLSKELEEILEAFRSGGGRVYRGSDFIGHLTGVRPSVRFEDGEGDVRVSRHTKAGCPFFLLINEGEEDRHGSLLFGDSGAAFRFDPVTGSIEPVRCRMAEEGFACDLTVRPGETVVIGLDPDALPLLGESTEPVIAEIAALSPPRMTFSFRSGPSRSARLRLRTLSGPADVTVNGQKAGRFLLRPFEIDVTPFLLEGENTVEILPENAFSGAEIRIYDETQS